MAMVSLSFKVEGRVQGVGFRYWTVKLARSLFITGYVTNRFDGTVFVHAQGNPFAMGRFRNELIKGPPGALVRDVIETPVEMDPSFSDFSIQ